MPRPSAERALRRLVASLATAEPEYIDAVLDQLTPTQRARTQTLLQNYLDGTRAHPTLPSDARGPELASTPGLSPWLAMRLGEDPRPERFSLGRPRSSGVSQIGRTDFSMTPAAVEALRSCVGELRIDTNTDPGEPVGWFGQLRRRIAEARAAL